jgi:hypothetical protein
MSVAIHDKRFTSLEKSSPSFPPVEPKVLFHHDPEAPERGRLEREAPEWQISRGVEAPDAGNGRAALLEHEFTHGRSQS